MLQLLARPEINSLKDLHGKKVNILPKGSIVPIVLKRVGVEIEEVNLSLVDAIDKMRTGEIYATACVCSVPIPAYLSVSSDLGFKLLEVPYIEALEGSYLPASLSSETYPNLIAKGSKVETVGSQPRPVHLQLGAWHRALQEDREVRERILLEFRQAEAAAASSRPGGTSISPRRSAAGSGFPPRSNGSTGRPPKPPLKPRRPLATSTSRTRVRRPPRRRLTMRPSRSACSRSSWSGRASGRGGEAS